MKAEQVHCPYCGALCGRTIADEAMPRTFWVCDTCGKAFVVAVECAVIVRTLSEQEAHEAQEPAE